MFTAVLKAVFSLKLNLLRLDKMNIIDKESIRENGNVQNLRLFFKSYRTFKF